MKVLYLLYLRHKHQKTNNRRIKSVLTSNDSKKLMANGQWLTAKR